MLFWNITASAALEKRNKPKVVQKLYRFLETEAKILEK